MREPIEDDVRPVQIIRGDVIACVADGAWLRCEVVESEVLDVFPETVRLVLRPLDA